MLAFAYRYLSHTGFPNDHFVHLATAQQMLAGALPVRDYVERGLPLMSAVSAAAQMALGEGLHSEVVLIAAAYGLAAAWTFRAAAEAGRSFVVGLVVAAMTVLVYPVSYSYPKLLAYAGTFVAAVWYVRAPGALPLATLAGGVASAFLFRHDHGLFLGAAVVAMLVALSGVTRRGLANVAAFLVVATAVTSPYLVWVQVHEGIGVYVADGIEFSRREADRTMRVERPAFGFDRTRPLFTEPEDGPIVNVRWRADLRSSDIVAAEREHRMTRLDPVGEHTWQYRLQRWSSSALAGIVRDPAVADTHGIDRSRFRLTDAAPGLLGGVFAGVPRPGEGLRLEANALAGLYYLAWLLPFVVVLALAAWWGRMPPTTRALAIMAVVVQFAMNASMLRDPLALRIRDVVVPMAMLLAIAWTLPRLVSGWMLRWASRVAVAAVVLATVGAAAGLGRSGERLDETRLFDGRQGVTERLAELRGELKPPAERTGTISDATRRLVSYLGSCTQAESRILALTFAPELFFYTGRPFAGGLVTLTPGNYAADRHAELILQRLGREDVPFVVLDSETEQEVRAGYPRLAQHLADTYGTAGRFPVSGAKEFIVLAETRRRLVREFGANRLPCFAGAAAQVEEEAERSAIPA